jgi:hypothetical protein
VKHIKGVAKILRSVPGGEICSPRLAKIVRKDPVKFALSSRNGSSLASFKASCADRGSIKYGVLSVVSAQLKRNSEADYDSAGSITVNMVPSLELVTSIEPR